MKTVIAISPNEKRTKDKFFNNDWLTIQPFHSNIVGLSLCLQNANGTGKRIPIWDTTIPVKENISDYGYFWFEYSSADKEYKITVDLN